MSDRHQTEGIAGSPFATRAIGLAWIALGLFVVLSRALAAPDILSEWDSANYVHGWLQFNVYEHSPHAPGYPLFVLVLWVLSWLPGPETTPFLILNTGLSLGVLAMLGWIARAEAGDALALGVAAAFAVCPAFWYHGAVSTAYVAECFCSTLVAWGAWALARRRAGVVTAAVLLALAGGIRPAALVYLSPLMALGLIASRRDWRGWLTFGGISGAGVLAWMVPTIALSGGWSQYNTSSKALAYWQSSTNSVLSGSWSEAVENAQHLALYVGDSLNLAMVLLVFSVVLVTLRRAWRPFWPLFIATWCLPASALYMLHHLPKAGYALTILPGLFLATGLALAAAWRSTEGRWRRGLAVVSAVWLGLVLAVNVAAFVLSVPVEALEAEEPEEVADAAVLITGDYGWRGIRWRTEPQRRTRELVDQLGGDDTVVLYLWGTHQLQRIDSVYHPRQWTLTSALDHGCVHSSRHETDDYCGTFGDLQVRILYPPEAGLSHRETTTISLQGTTLTLQRAGRQVAVELDPLPSRLLVVAPCPPCAVDLGTGLHETSRLRVTARNRMIVAEVRAGAVPVPDAGGSP